MGKKEKRDAASKALRELQVDLSRLQKHVIKSGKKVLVLFEGRDASGKDGTIKRIVEHLSPRDTRVVALGKPSDRDQRSWYFQRWVPKLPAGGEIVLFNRSWYNRAGVERVMGFCSDEDYEEFLTTAPLFEQLLAHCGVTIVKYYLDISRSEQKRRLKERRDDPLKQWKLSPMDLESRKRWEEYTKAKEAMLERTHIPEAPWWVVQAVDKKKARLNCIAHLLGQIPYQDVPHPHVVLPERVRHPDYLRQPVPETMIVPEVY